MASTAPAEYAPGALVWAKTTGHGWWPGQVTPRDNSLVPPKVRKQARSKALLLSFFGDGSWGWFEAGTLQSFEEHYEEHKDAAPAKGGARIKADWRRGVEEAKELSDTRAGRTPATSHSPPDILNPETWPKASDDDDSDDEEEEEGAPARWKEPVSAQDCADVAAPGVLAWLRLASKDPDSDQVHEPQAGASARQLWSCLHTRATATWGSDAWRLRNRGTKRKPSAAAARAAAAAAAAAAAPETSDAQRSTFGGALAVVLSDIPKLLRLGAVDPGALLGRRGALTADVAMAHAEAGVLRFREAMCCDSVLLKSGREGDWELGRLRIGSFLKRKLRALGVMPPRAAGEKISSVKGKKGKEGRGGARAGRKPSKVAVASKAKGRAEERAGSGKQEEASSSSSSSDDDGSSSSDGGDKKSRDSSSSSDDSSSSEGEGEQNGTPSRRAQTAVNDAARKGKRPAADDSPGHRRQPAKLMRLTPRVQRREGGAADGEHAGGGGRGAAVPAAPSPRPMERIEVVWVDYAGRLGSKEAFEAAFQRWCGERNKAVELPSVQGARDAYALFAAVATRGGYDAVSSARGWRTVALMWHEPLRQLKDAGARVQAAYKKALLGFEKSFASGAPTRKVTVEVPVPQGAAAARAAAGAQGRAAGAAAGGAGGAGPSRGSSLDDRDRAALPSPRTSAGGGPSTSAGGRGRLVPVEESDPERRRLIIKFKDGIPMPRDDALLRLAQRLCPELRFADVLPVAIRNSCHITFPSAAQAQAAEGALPKVAPQELGLEQGCVAAVKRVRTTRVAQDAAVAAASAANGIGQEGGGGGLKQRQGAQQQRQPPPPPQQRQQVQPQRPQQPGTQHAGYPQARQPLPPPPLQQEQYRGGHGHHSGAMPPPPMLGQAAAAAPPPPPPPRAAVYSTGVSAEPLLPPSDPRARRMAAAQGVAAQGVASQGPAAYGAAAHGAVAAVGGPSDPRAQRMQAGAQAIPGIAMPADPRRQQQQISAPMQQPLPPLPQQRTALSMQQHTALPMQQQYQQQPQQGYAPMPSYSQLPAAGAVPSSLPPPPAQQHGQQAQLPAGGGDVMGGGAGGLLSGINLSKLVSAIQQNQHSGPPPAGALSPVLPQASRPSPQQPSHQAAMEQLPPPAGACIAQAQQPVPVAAATAAPAAAPVQDPQEFQAQLQRLLGGFLG